MSSLTDIDLAAVLKASRAISGEIVLEKLLAKVMRAAVESAGAELGILVLKNAAGLSVEARSAAGGEVELVSVPVAEDEEIAQSVVLFVARSGDPVVLAEATAEPQFSHDPYVQRRRPLSVMCLPVVHQSELVGVFYLENNLARGAFDESHLDVLQLLASQAATSIENAKLYETLGRSERKHRALMEAMPDGVMVHSEGVVRFVNQTAVELLGAETSDDVVGREALSFVHPDDRAAAASRMEKVYARSGPMPPVEYKLVRLDGGTVEVDMSAAAVEFQGRPASQVVLRDITDRKLAERQLFRAEKMASLGQIIAGVAHEINNPNNFVYFNLPILRGYLEAIRPHLDRAVAEEPDVRLCNMTYDELMEDIDKLLDNMTHGSTRITEIVKELKDYVGSSQEEVRKPGSLDAVVDSVMTLVGKQVRKTVARFDVDVEEDLPKVVMNAGKIEQVLINLVINAGQAADKENSFVRLEARRGPPGSVRITVEDNGSGIPEELRDTIFDPFFTTKGRETGTGLGLAISHRIVEDHAGAITVDSTPGEGTRFTIDLPAEESDGGTEGA